MVDPVPTLYLLPLDDSFFPPKRIALVPGSRVRVGRQLNPKSTPNAGNGVFESRVLSRQHAEVWVEDDRILIRDVKSSNGTFVNGERLSPEGVESDPYELRSDDILLGVVLSIIPFAACWVCLRSPRLSITVELPFSWFLFLTLELERAARFSAPSGRLRVGFSVTLEHRYIAQIAAHDSTRPFLDVPRT
ncbi:SMAD/FHA domain-containing protein [Mycena sanguinolenta]|nr:SMAD/FHA domain-containing protein [Mycena sanguinolenta]